MNCIGLHSITKSYGGEFLFQNICGDVCQGNRLAVIGPNGCGKSTLLKIVAGKVEPDSGKVVVPREVQKGFMEQELTPENLTSSLLAYVLEVVPDWTLHWEDWRGVDDAAHAEKLSEKLEVLERRWGYNPEQKAKKILSGLGFVTAQFQQPLNTFSGGWRERAKMARTLLAGKDVLLLDEPTNHLDMEAIFWLEEFLLSYEGVMLFVAHDRYFLDRVSTHTLPLGMGKPVIRPGNFSDYVQWMEALDQHALKETGKIAKEIQRQEVFINRFRYKATKARQVQSRVIQLDKLKDRQRDLVRDREEKGLSFSWPEPARRSKVAVTATDVWFSYEGGTELFKGISLSMTGKQKVSLVGPNGTGKSTLLKLILQEQKPERGEIRQGMNTIPAYFSQGHGDRLRWQSTVLSELTRLSHESTTEQEKYSVLGMFGLGESYWNRKIEEISGGERNRVILASLFLSKANFLILDEPTNHLDMESRTGLIESLQRFSGGVLFVAHDRFLIEEVADEIWELLPQGGMRLHDTFQDYLRNRTYLHVSEENPEKGRNEGIISVKKDVRKEEKRKQAEERNRRYRKLKPLQRAYREKEMEMEGVLKEQDRVEKMLYDQSTYNDGKQIEELNKKYADLQTTSENLLEELSRLEEKITAVEKAYQEE